MLCTIRALSILTSEKRNYAPIKFISRMLFEGEGGEREGSGGAKVLSRGV